MKREDCCLRAGHLDMVLTSLNSYLHLAVVITFSC